MSQQINWLPISYLHTFLIEIAIINLINNNVFYSKHKTYILLQYNCWQFHTFTIKRPQKRYRIKHIWGKNNINKNFHIRHHKHETKPQKNLANIYTKTITILKRPHNIGLEIVSIGRHSYCRFSFPTLKSIIPEGKINGDCIVFKQYTLRSVSDFWIELDLI